MDNKREELLQESMGKLFLKMAIPGMIGMMVVGLYNLVDSIFVGQFISPAAVSAVTMGFAVILVNQAILSLFGSGAMSMFSRALGAEDYKTTDALFGNVFWLVGICSLILTFFTYTYAREILVLFGASGEILRLGIDYLQILAFGFVFGALGPALNFLIRGEGQMKSAMKIVSLGIFTNILLDPIFIQVLGMGIKGAAVATIIGQGLIVVANFFHFCSSRSIINLNLSSFRISWHLVPDMMKIGSSAMIMSLAVALQLGILLALSSSFGDASNIVMSSSFRVMSFFYIPLFGIAYGLQPVLGANYGAKQFSRVSEAYWYFGKVATIIAICLWVLFQIFAPFILSAFITDETIVAEGTKWFRIFQGSFLLYGFVSVSIMLFTALGKAKKAALTTLGRQIFFFIPLVFLLPRLFGEIGLWAAYPLGDVLVTIMGVYLVAGELKLLKAEAGVSGKVSFAS